jgi:hypothetical protein
MIADEETMLLIKRTFHAPIHRSQRNDGVHVATGRAADCRKPSPARAWLEQRDGKIGTLLGDDKLT